MTTDKILELPLELQDRILQYMPLRDLVGTDILSTSWRDRWIDYPRLNLTYDPNMLIIPYNALLCHRGTISEVFIDCGNYSVNEALTDLSNWIVSLGKNGVKAIKLDFSVPNNNMSASLFSFCPKLKSLSLRNCWLTLQDSGTAFENLRTLTLKFCNGNPVDIENIIRASKSLEELTLFKVDLTTITISASKLKKISYEGYCNEVCLTDCPSLISAEIIPKLPEEGLVRTASRALHWPSKLMMLKTNGNFIKSLAPRCGRDGLLFMNLEYLNLEEVNFCDSDHMAVITSILRKCINLKKLAIQGFGSRDVDESLHVPDEDGPKKCSFGILKDVKIEMSVTDGLPAEAFDVGFFDFFETIRMVYCGSPELENMTVKYGTAGAKNVRFLRKMMGLTRASSKLRLKIF